MNFTLSHYVKIRRDIVNVCEFGGNNVLFRCGKRFLLEGSGGGNPIVHWERFQGGRPRLREGDHPRHRTSPPPPHRGVPQGLVIEEGRGRVDGLPLEREQRVASVLIHDQ